MAFESRGTISVTNNSTAVTGTGTYFNTVPKGYRISINGLDYGIAQIADATHLTLTRPFAEATASGVHFEIYPTESYAADVFSEVSDLTLTFLPLRNSVTSFNDTIDARADEALAAAAAAAGSAASALADKNTTATLKGDVITLKADVTTLKSDVTALKDTATTQAGIATTKAGEAAASAASALSDKNATATLKSDVITLKADVVTLKSDVTTLKDTATTQAGIATTKAGEAAGSATTASTQAGISTTKAGEAAASASAALTSKNAAATSEANALTYKNAASTSAADAATSKSGADTALSLALAAQTAAEAARDAALTAYDNFDDRMLGSKASDPTLDNDGNALLSGALYYNTTANEMRVYTGSIWVAAYVSGSSFLPLTGGTMTGPLTLAANPSANLHAATKQYVDGASITGNAATATKWATGRTIALTGDITGTSAAFDGSGNLSFATTLANSGVTAGTYPKVTVDAKGRVTAGSNLSLSDVTTGLGFTPLQQGGGTNQGSNKVYIGWHTTGDGLRLQIDATDYGKSWPINVTGTAASITGPYTGSITSGQITGGLGYVPANRAGDTFTAPVYVRNTGTNGFVGLIGDRDTNTGYITFVAPNGTRQAYIGFSSSTGAQDTGTLPYVAGTHAFTGNATVSGNLTVGGTIAGTITSSQVTSALGFTPANRAGDTFTGAVNTPGGTHTGQVSFNGVTGNSVIANSTGGLGAAEVKGNGTGAAMMQFHRPGVFAAYLGVDTDNFWKVGGWSMGANSYKIYHEGAKPAKSDVGLGNVDNTADAVKSVNYANSAGLVRPASAATTTATDIIYHQMADNDFVRLRSGGNASNSGWVELATADDGNEPIYVSQYTGVFSTLARRAALLDENGNTTFPNTVYGNHLYASGNVTAANAIYASNWHRNYGVTGLYNETYGRGIVDPESTSNYGNIATYSGGKNGWSGFSINNWVSFMANGSGTGSQRGFYSAENGGWLCAWDTSNNAVFSGNVTAYSDERLKKDMRPITDAAERRKGMAQAAIVYERDGQTRIGFGAQTLEKTNPEFVKTADDLVGTKSVAYAEMVSVLAVDADEQSRRIDALEAQVAILLNTIEQLQNRLQGE